MEREKEIQKFLFIILKLTYNIDMNARKFYAFSKNVRGDEMANEVGKKIKHLRSTKHMTLKELSEKTNLSIGFLSQVERGLTTLAIASLESIAEALDVDLSYFFSLTKKSNKRVMRSYEKEIFRIENGQYVDYHLSRQLKEMDMLPRFQEILPSKSDTEVTSYQHNGEEFIYVLEGVLTLMLDNQQYELYPGDSIHFKSNIVHNWTNYSNKMVRILTVNIPNNFRQED